MKTTIEIKLNPFDVPNVVHEDLPLIPAAPAPTQEYQPRFVRQNLTLPLSDLSAETLDKMCEEFTKSVFKKAGKIRPPSIVNTPDRND